PIPEHAIGLERGQAARGRERLQPSLDESPDPDVRAYQQGSIRIFAHCLDAVGLAGHRIEGRRTGFPTPQPRQDADPEVPLAIFLQARDQGPQPPVLALAGDAAWADRTKLRGRHAVPGRPHNTLAILDEPRDELPGELRVLPQLAVLQAR